MARHLHTRVADDIRAACTHNGEVDREQEAEMRMESTEYANEVRGFYDEDVDPSDFDERDDYPERDEDFDENDGEGHYEGPEDLGWDGGMEM